MTIQGSERKYEQDLKQQMDASRNASYFWVLHIFTLLYNFSLHVLSSNAM